MTNPHDAKYRTERFYWGQRPSAACYDVLRLLPPDQPLKLLDIGCGEGRNSIFFARNGYDVTAFDLSEVGVDKAKTWAAHLNLSVDAFTADLTSFRLETPYDTLFSTGSLHYLESDLRSDVFAQYKAFTNPGGLHAFSVFVEKPFVPPAPDAEASAQLVLCPGSTLRHQPLRIGNASSYRDTPQHGSAG